MVRVDAATGWSLGLWFVLGLVPTVGQSVGWHALLNHQGLAAWIQAVGSIAAIAAAIYVASSQHRREMEARQAEAAEEIALRQALIAHAQKRVEWLLLLLWKRSDGYYDIADAAAWEKAVKNLQTMKKALDAVEFHALRHSAEVFLLTEAQGALDDVAGLLSLITNTVPGWVSGTVHEGLTDGQRLLQRVGERYDFNIERNWGR